MLEHGVFRGCCLLKIKETNVYTRHRKPNFGLLAGLVWLRRIKEYTCARVELSHPVLETRFDCAHPVRHILIKLSPPIQTFFSGAAWFIDTE